MSPDAQRTAPENASPAAPARLSLAAYNLHQVAERTSEILIYAMVVFSPWAFGCTNSLVLPNWTVFGVTQAWTIWTMNFAGYLLAVLLLAKLVVRRFTGYRPPRWGEAVANDRSRLVRFLARAVLPALAALTGLILLFCLTSALNARSSYRPELFRFDYYQNSLAWLPHSYDASNTWLVFWNYLALAGSFWGVHYWLGGKTAGESRAERKAAGGDPGRISLLPERLRRLLWVMSINGALLGIEGLAQRLSGTNKLLWYLPTHLNREAQFQFGPYAYRSNAAQYFNLLWPVTLAFWWTLRRAAHFTGAHTGRAAARWYHLLLPAVMIMVVCPIISTSRGGVIIAVLTLPVAALILLAALKRAHGATKFGMFLLVAVTLCVGFGIDGEKLGGRMKEFGSLHVRERMYEVGHLMADEHRLFGTGPGTFNQLFQFYRSSPDEYWPAQLHNDWLETRITFGRLGSALIAAAFLVVATRRLLPGGIQCGWRFTALLWLALLGCLAHARFDFPFQIYSIVFLFLVLCAILSNLSRPAAAP